LDDLKHRREHVERFGLSLDMVQLPLAPRQIEESQSPHVLLGRDPPRQRQLDSICLLIDQIGAAGIPTAKYNLNIIGIPRTARSRAWRIASHGVSLAECGRRCRAGCSWRGQ
jgi:mannonate dehydratase